MTLEPSGNSSSIDAKTWTIIIWALYIGSCVTAVSGILGVILAYVKRDDLRGTPFESHITSAIRTFWVALIVGLVGTILIFVAIGFIVLLALAVWVLFRSIRGLVLALDSKPIADPQGWL